MSLFNLTCFPNICNPFGVTGTSFPIEFNAEGQPGITGTCYLTGINNGNSFFVCIHISLNQSVTPTSNCLYEAGPVIPPMYSPSPVFTGVQVFPCSVIVISTYNLMTWGIDFNGNCSIFYTGGNNSSTFDNLSGVYSTSP